MELGKYKFVGGTSDKFWHIIHDLSNNTFIAKWGRNGNKPQGSKEYSRAEAHKKIMEKLKKGYVKVEGSQETEGNNSIHFITSPM